MKRHMICSCGITHCGHGKVNLPILGMSGVSHNASLNDYTYLKKGFLIWLVAV